MCDVGTFVSALGNQKRVARRDTHKGKARRQAGGHQGQQPLLLLLLLLKALTRTMHIHRRHAHHTAHPPHCTHVQTIHARTFQASSPACASPLANRARASRPIIVGAEITSVGWGSRAAGEERVGSGDATRKAGM